MERTRWFVFKLSICFLNSTVHRSLQRNLITSRLSLNRGRSRENLDELVDVSQRIQYLVFNIPPANLNMTEDSAPLPSEVWCTRARLEDRGGGYCIAFTHLSARPCPTRYPRDSRRKYVDSRTSSSSGLSCVARSLARRSAIGTSSMRRKSKHEELRARAFGSEMDNEAEASKDIVGWRGVFQEEVVKEGVKLKVCCWLSRC